MREWLHLLGPTPPSDGPLKWFERDEGDARLAHDRALIAEAYPDLKFALNFKFRQVVAQGTITLREENTGVPTVLKTKIIFPDSYPELEPIALDDGGHFHHIADRHFYKSGVCCLWLPLESQWRRDDPDTLLNFVHQVAIFFERQLIYEASGGVWAWGERGHDEAGYIEFLEEQFGTEYKTIEIFLPAILGKVSIGGKSKCPCKSGRTYGLCHKTHVELVKKRIEATGDKGIRRLLEQVS